MTDRPNTKGQILRVSKKLNGMTAIVADNGPFQTATFHCRTEDYADALEAGIAEMLALVSRRDPARFRRKPKRS